MSGKSLTNSKVLIPTERIEHKIYLIRGCKMMLDSDLAELYQVQTKQLNRAVARHPDRFPDDFMIQLTPEEIESLRCQIGTSNVGRGGRRYRPYAFTEHGVAMLSSVLGSPRAVQMNILIIRAFVRMREPLDSHRTLSDRIDQVETIQSKHTSVIRVLADEIDKLKFPPTPTTKRIGFAQAQ